MRRLLYGLVWGGALLPGLALAQAASDLESFASQIIDIINNLLVPLLLAIAFIVFVWGVFQYFIFGSNDEATKTKGRDKILYGLIGFFVIISVWGIVNLLVNTFELDQEAKFKLPQAETLR